MRTALRNGLLLGVLNAVVAVAVLALTEKLAPGSRGWFAYAPLQDVHYAHEPFPWAYVAVPVALAVLNVAAFTAHARRR